MPVSVLGSSKDIPSSFHRDVTLNLFFFFFPLMKLMSGSWLVFKHTLFHLDLDLLSDTLNLASCQSGLAYAKSADVAVSWM